MKSETMKTYEELRGSEGRQIFFRAHRYEPRDLFKRAVPELILNQMAYRLENLSMTGLAVMTPKSEGNLYLAQQAVNVQLRLDDEVLFAGKGQVVRTAETRRGVQLGISFRDCSFNIPEVVAEYEELQIRRDLESLGQASPDLVPEAYRVLCSDVLHFLRAYKASLDRPAQTGDASGQANAIAAFEDHILPRWRDLWKRANAIVEPLLDDPEAMLATKRFTEMVLTPDFMAGPIWKRSYEKPLGYPGDFQIMQMVYDWQYRGETVYEKLVHRLGLDVAECIATRMTVMREVIADTVIAKAGAGRDEPARITSVGCGPAREVSDYLKIGTPPGPVQFTLIDQDHDALSHAYESTYTQVMRMGGKASVNCLNVAFNQLFDTEELFGRLAEQDLIYTVGLVDYLKPRRAKVWISSLFQFLAPGGRLVISNMLKTEMSNFWAMEFITDWNVIFRTEEEMLALAEDIPASNVTTRLDPTGRVCMLIIEK